MSSGNGDGERPGRESSEDNSELLRCFVVSAFGSTADEQRRNKQVLRHLIKKSLGDRYDVVRADQIDDEGLITNQIIEHLLEDHLVIADLSGRNPNVFYEIAVRHATRKPIVHLIAMGEELPFDVANMRAVQYALDDPDVLEEAQEDLRRKVDAIEGANWNAGPNPVSAARDVWLLRSSERPDDRQAAEMLTGLAQLQDEVRSLARRVRTKDKPANPGAVQLTRSEVDREVEMIVTSSSTGLRLQEVTQEFQNRTGVRLTQRFIREALDRLGSRGAIHHLDSGLWSDIPF